MAAVDGGLGVKVKLVSYTQTEPVPGEHPLYPEELVAYCARVSNPANQSSRETQRLIQYLIEHKHWSPFEMVSACLEIETTRDIARQILRHRSFSFQEFSQRYADPTKELDFVTREARLQDHKNRQNSIKTNNHSLQYDWERKQEAVLEAAREAYFWAVANGIAKEQARCVLPEGMTMSRMYVNGTLRSWIHYIDVRTDKSTQLEHREVAEACAEELAKLFKNTMKVVKRGKN